MGDGNTAAAGQEKMRVSRAPELLGAELPFVNRERELAALESSLGRAIGGRGRLVLIAGEPGIGKTRLLSELISVAEAAKQFASSPCVVVGRCWDSGGAPTLWPWSTVLRQLVGDVPPERLRHELGTGAGWIAALVPELHDVLPELGQAPPLDTEQSRFVLFDAIASFLRRAAERQPLLVVLDDLHAADRFSLLALVFLARQLETIPLLVIGTQRESEVGRSERLAALFARLEREALRITLPGLGKREISELIGHHAGAPAPALTDTLHEATGGNPFFIDEALRMLHARGGLERLEPAQLVPLSSGVQAVIEQRLAALSDDVVGTLRCAATVGSVFSLAVVTQARGVPRTEVAGHIEQSTEEGLARARPGELGVYEWGHALIRETVQAGMSAAERAAMHYAVALALERRYAASVESHLEELAHHFLEAVAAGDPAPALRYAEQAAEHAMSLFAHERAARLYAAALEVLDLVEDLEPEERVLTRARLLLGRGRAFQRLGDSRARETLREAAATARTAGAPELLGRVALTFGAFALSPGTVDRDLVALLREALDAEPAPAGQLRAALLGRLARALYWEPDPAPRMALAEEAIAQARSLGEPASLAAALGNGLAATRSIDTTDQSLHWIDEILSIPEAPWETIVVARSNEIDLLLERGQINAADAAIESLHRYAERLQDLRVAPYVPVQRARRAMMEGRFDEAQQLTREASEATERIEDSTFPLTIAGMHIGLGLLAGHPERALESAEPLARSLPEMRVWRASLVAALVALNRFDDARRELERALVGGVKATPRDVMWLITMALLSEGAAALGDAERAGEMYELLEPFAARNVISPVCGYRGPVDRYLGLLALSQDEVSVGEAHLRSALAIAERQHAQPMAETIGADLARVPGRRPARRAAAGVEGTEGSLIREGDVWALSLEGRAVRVRDSKGMQHLAVLLGAPGQELHALELARGTVSPVREAPAEAGLAIADASAGSGPVLDNAAKSAYRRRLQDLEEELEEAERFGDPERAAQAREELDFITAELAAAVGLGGRDRAVGSDAERARVNVTRALRTAIRRVAEADEQLGAELEGTVRTGLFCAYQPDPRRPVRWSVSG